MNSRSMQHPIIYVNDHSFQSVVLDLNSGAFRIVPGIRNGFASAIDHTTGQVYLGGSYGIYKCNYHHADIEKPAIVCGVDVFDMFYSNKLYYVDTTNLDLHVFHNNHDYIFKTVEYYGIHHFVTNLIFANPTGLYVLKKVAEIPESIRVNLNGLCGVTIDVHGVPYVISQNGVCYIDVESKIVSNIVTLENGHALTFDRDNNIVCGEERYVAKLTSITECV